MKRMLVVLAVVFFMHGLYGAGETWTRLSPSGTPPSARWGSASVYDSIADRFIVWGGGVWGGVFNDLYALDSTATGNGVWRRLTPSGSVPPAKHLTGHVYDAPRRRMIIFGGYNQAGGCDNTVYFLDSVNSATPRWSFRTPTGSRPTSRQSSAAAYDPIRQRMIVFSGWCGFVWYNDVWVIENLATTPAWRRLSPIGTGPGGRWSATCVYDSNHDRLLVFGGQNASQQYTSDIWALESLQVSDGRWRLLSPSGTPPVGRMSLASTLDFFNDRMLIFGGGNVVVGGGGTQLNDLWGLNAVSSTPSWTQITASGTIPAARYGPSCALDAARRRLIIFGGYGGGSGNYNDVYTLTWNVGVADPMVPNARRLVVSVKPNPFRRFTTLTTEGAETFVTAIMVHDAQGRLLRRWPSNSERSVLRVVWDGTDEKGSSVSAGTYFVVVETDQGSMVRRVVKIR